jgi:hypothetical protein
MRKSIGVMAILAIFILFVIVKCSPPAVSGKTVVLPQPFPDSSITGISFPTDSNTILGWTNNPAFPTAYDSMNIYRHAWGIWAGLTAPTKQSVGGDSLMVYETWLGLSEIRQYIIDNVTCEPGQLSKSSRAPLSRPRQFEHAGMLARSISLEAINEGPLDTARARNLWVTVSYSPPMACHAINNKLLKQSVLNTYYQPNGFGQIPSFPDNSIFIKPTYLEYRADAKILKMPVWLNPPNPADSLNCIDPNQFPYMVYVDVSNSQPANKTLVPVTRDCKSHDSIANATCNLSDFINFTVDSTMAAFMNAQDSIQGLAGKGKARKGNRVLLVAMHVGTKEISNWTWQSFYWTPLTSTPGAPSSDLAASLMPNTVKGAARHYAANAAYVMTTPNNSAAANAGSMFGYNPYLEGGFGPSTFEVPNTWQPQFKYGMQSNCMSCHSLAVPAPANDYCTDQVINLTDPKLFKAQVRLDFAWSIQTGLINDTIPYWNFKN